MIGVDCNPVNHRPYDLVVTELSVTLPGRPSTNQLEFGIPVIRDVISDRLCLASALRGNRYPGILSDFEHGKSQSGSGMIAFCGEEIKATRKESTATVLVPNSVRQECQPIQKASCNMQPTSVASFSKGKTATLGHPTITPSDDTDPYKINCDKTCSGTIPKLSVGNSDTSTGLPQCIEDFIKTTSRPLQNKSTIPEGNFDDHVQGKTHLAATTGQFHKRCVNTATTENYHYRIAEVSIDNTTGVFHGFQGLPECDVGFIEISSRIVQSPPGASEDDSSKTVQSPPGESQDDPSDSIQSPPDGSHEDPSGSIQSPLGASQDDPSKTVQSSPADSQDDRDESIQDDSYSASDPLPDSSSQIHPVVPLGEERMTLNPKISQANNSENALRSTQSKPITNKQHLVQTLSSKQQEQSNGSDWNVVNRNSVLYKNARRKHSTKT